MPKNILLFMTDQQRADYVGYAKDGCGAVTPNIDRIAAHAYFTNCQTTNPICTPARTSLITGRYSHQIGTLTMAGDLFPQIPTFMQALQKKAILLMASANSIICRRIPGPRPEAAVWI